MTRRIASLLFPAIVVACVSDGGNGTVGSDTPCGRYFNSLVSFAQRCGRTSGFEGQAGIATRFETVCNSAASAPGGAHVISDIDRCAVRVESQSCVEDTDCDFAAGTLADGAACEETYQCQGFCRKNSTDDPCGSCAPAVPLGGVCDTGSTCAARSTCQITTGTQGTCVTKTSKSTTVLPIGSTCKTSSDCDQTQAECKESKCTALPSEGQECTYLCGAALACNQDKRCVKPAFVKNGEPCDLARLCQDSICVGLSFSSSSNGDGTTLTTVNPGTCVVPLPDGAACTKDDKISHCNTFASCVQGTCQVPNPSACK